MRQSLTLVFLIFCSIILELSLLPLLGFSSVPLSVIAIGVASLVLLNLYVPSLVWAIIGGLAADLATSELPGWRLVVLVAVWFVTLLVVRLKISVNETVVLFGLMGLIGVINFLPYFLLSWYGTGLIISFLLHALLGVMIFRLLARLLLVGTGQKI